MDRDTDMFHLEWCNYAAKPSNGVLFKSGDATEILSKISVAIVDKTGTLTKGNPQVTDVIQLNKTAAAIVTSIGSSIETTTSFKNPSRYRGLPQPTN